MTARLSCYHGHELGVTEPLESDSFVCPRCGSITRLRRAAAIKKSGSVDPTIDSVGSSDGPPQVAADLAEAVPEASQFQSLPQDDVVAEPSDVSAKQSGSHADSLEDFEPPKLAGYQVLDELGRGGMGVVYRARDQSLGREVALKTLQRMSPSALHRFKQEFRTLADIAHPNLASLYELLSDGKTWCFTMEMLQGVDFLEYVWSGFAGLDAKADDCQPINASKRILRLTPARQQRLEDALGQLAVGLNTLHEAGVLHSDIKPSNVLISQDGRLVLLDFGLAADIRKQDAAEKRFVQGTPIYMSPEQAAGEPLSAASDWYAVGVILYEVLTGHLPFSGPTMQVMHRKQLETPLQPNRLASDTPEHLNDLCIALLDRDPQRRPAAANVLRCIGANVQADTVTAHHQAAIRSVELVGRERHFQILSDALERVSAGETLSIFVHGESGMGKSVLVHNFLNTVQQQAAAVVLQGRCYEQESVPFKALDSVIDSLSEYLATLPGETAQVVMPRDRLALTRVFPVLGGVPESPGAAYPSIDNVDQQELRQRAMNALRELLQRLGIRQPLVMYVDDLQWGDVDSAALLADLVRPPDAPRMLLLGSYRSEDVDRSLCLRALADAYSKGQQLPHREELAVESLTPVESTRLALTLLGRDDDASRSFANKIAEESAGWPFFVWELAQHVQEDPAIADQTLNLDEVIWARVCRLPQDARQLLELIAIAGRPMPTVEFYQAVDAVSQGPRWLAQLRAANFVRTTESDDEATVVEMYHDRIRESVCEHLDPQQVRAYNLDLALMIQRASGVRVEDLQAHIDSTGEYEEADQPCELEQQVWQRVFDLAYFFDAAGLPERAFPYALVAAEKTWSQNALEVAQLQYRIAARGAESVANSLRFRVAEGLGDVLMTAGKYDEARQQFETAEALTTADVASARIDGKLGTLFFKKGDMGNAAMYLETALKKLGDPPPKSALVRAAKLSKEGVIQLLHTYWPSQFLSRRSSATPRYRKDMLRVRIYDRLTIVYWFTRGMIPTLWSHLRQMNLAERYPPSQELGKTYSFHAITMTGIPNARRGITYAEKAYQISSDLGDLWGQGQARSFHTFSCIVLARLDEAVKMSREAVRLLEQAGDVWEANMARMIGTMAVYHLGDLELALQESKRAYEIGCQTGDYSAMAIAMWLWVQIDPLTVPAEGIKQELQRPREDPLTEALAIQARGLELLLRDDQPREANEVLEQCLDLARRSSIRNVCVFSGVSWNATALRRAAEREPEGTTRRRAVRKARRAARDALKITKSYLNCRPHALRERALVAVLQGHQRQARRYFDESLRLAREHQARHEYAQTLHARNEAGIKFGWPQVDGEL